MPAIKLDGVGKATFKDVRIGGFDVGIASENSHIEAQNVTFDRVRVPFQVNGGSADVEQSAAYRIPSADPTASGSGSVGKRGLHAPAIPAQCAKCGSIFPSRMFTVFNAGIRSHENTEKCPVCRSEGAAIADGLFEVATDIIRLVAGPETTRARMEFLRSLAEEVGSRKITTEDAAEIADKAVPGLGVHIRKMGSFGVAAFLALAILAGAYADIPPLARDVSVWSAEVLSEYFFTEVQGRPSDHQKQVDHSGDFNGLNDRKSELPPR